VLMKVFGKVRRFSVFKRYDYSSNFLVELGTPSLG